MKRVAVYSLVLLAVLSPAVFSNMAFFDLDIEVPPGSPLDWDKELNQPIPTGRGQVTIGTGTPVSPTGEAPSKTPPPVNLETGSKQGKTWLEATPPPKPSPVGLEYGVTNLYNFLRITTVDIMNHISPKIPSNPPITENIPKDIGTGGGKYPKASDIDTGPGREKGAEAKQPPAGGKEMAHGISMRYPPVYPTELCWIAIANCLRSSLHPELMNNMEASAYLVEIGEPSLVGAQMGTDISANVQRLVAPDLELKLPALPKGKGDAMDEMLIRLAVSEIISGFPYAFDPTYARRVLSLGDGAYPAVKACLSTPHAFLGRNAVAIIANLDAHGEAVKDLRDIFKKSRDAVARLRALSGLVRKRDRESVPLLMAELKNSDGVIRSAVMFALGMIGRKDAKIAEAIIKDLKDHPEPDEAWTGVSALARNGDGSKKTLEFIKALKNSIKDKIPQGAANPIPLPQQQGGQRGGFVPPISDMPGTKYKIIDDAALLALAANGDATAKTEVIAKAGQGQLGFMKATWYLVGDVLPFLGDEGVQAAKTFIERSDMPTNCKVNAVRRLAEAIPDEVYFKGLVSAGSVPEIRAAALMKLFEIKPEAVKDVAHPFVAGSSADASAAFLSGTAIQLLGRIKANKGEDLMKTAQDAYAAKAWGKRLSDNNPDITKAKIEVFPPLLEIALVELGKTGHRDAVGFLTTVARDKVCPARAEAILALGSIASSVVPLDQTAMETILAAMEDPDDGWVRFTAFRVMREISKQDFPVDWIFGKDLAIAFHAKRYREWYDSTKSGGK